MMKKILLLLVALLLYNCKTVDFKTRPGITNPLIIENNIPEDTKSLYIIRERLSSGIIAESDPYYGDFASIILNLIEYKKWEELSMMTSMDYYNSYVIESNGELVDYCMFMLHTGDKGISTNYSLNSVKKVYYTSSSKNEHGVIFEGIYVYPSGETEFFKIFILNDISGLIITRE